METHKNYSAAEYEETLCVILREILCTDSVGVTDDLFELGLSSLGALSGEAIYHFDEGSYYFSEGFGRINVDGKQLRGTIEFSFNGDKTRWEGR